MNKIKKYLYTQLFNASIIGIFLNPFYIARANLYRNIKKLSAKVPKVGKLLDVGCGAKPYKVFFENIEYIGLEIESSQNRAKGEADVFYDGNEFPFEPSSFNIVLANQVLEHVFNPEEFLMNINRVLVNDGFLLLTVPFVWDEHEQPYDYARYSSFGLKHILNKSGFDIEIEIKSVQGFGVIFQLINAYLYKTIRSFSKLLYFILLPIFCLNNMLGMFFNFILPKNPDLYLDNIILAKKRNNG